MTLVGGVGPSRTTTSSRLPEPGSVPAPPSVREVSYQYPQYFFMVYILLEVQSRVTEWGH